MEDMENKEVQEKKEDQYKEILDKIVGSPILRDAMQKHNYDRVYSILKDQYRIPVITSGIIYFIDNALDESHTYAEILASIIKNMRKIPSEFMTGEVETKFFGIQYDVNIQSKGNSFKQAVNPRAFVGCKLIKTLTISESVTGGSIGAFTDCNIDEVVWDRKPDFMWFRNCTGTKMWKFNAPSLDAERSIFVPRGYPGEIPDKIYCAGRFFVPEELESAFNGKVHKI